MRNLSITRVLAALLFCLMLISCGQVYYNRDGEAFRMLKQKRDRIFVDSQHLKAHAFDFNAFLQQHDDLEPSIQYVLPSDIKALVKETKELFIILYYPNCKGAEGYVKLAKRAEDLEIPVLLISIINNPEDMLKWYNMENLDNRNCYILPTTHHYGEAILTKKIRLVSDLCESCAQRFRDELLYTEFIILKEKGKVIKLDLADDIMTTEDAAGWMVKNFSE